jgi:hypothetical protein
VPDQGFGQTVPGAALRWSLAPGTHVVQSTNYSNALIDAGGNKVKGNTGFKGVLNPAAFSPTPDFGLSNAPAIFPSIRNPGSFFTDATLLKKLYFSSNESRYFEIRLEAQNIFNHPNYNTIDNNPNDVNFGGVQGKTGQRIMQVGARLFF